MIGDCRSSASLIIKLLPKILVNDHYRGILDLIRLPIDTSGAAT